MSIENANHYSRRILLAVSGMSPQIVTETLYSVAMRNSDSFVPTEIHLITTQTGAMEARLQLLHPATGKFHQLCRDYNLPNICFPEENIHVIQDDQGQLLDDIKTPRQNEAAADFITSVVSELTRDENSALHVSIAGGRKTMGYYLGYALSLYGRHQDCLSHVLVTDRYESLKDFFYPTPYSHVIFDKQNRALDTKDAEVMLAEIPFVRLRGGIPEHLLKGKAGFSDSVRFVRQIESEPILVIDYANCCFWVSDVKVAVTELHFAFYLWVLQRSLEGDPIKRSQYEDNSDYAQEFLTLFKHYSHALKDDDRTQSTLSQGMSSNWMSERISQIKKDFELALGKQAAKLFIIKKSGKNNCLQYRIDLTEEQIRNIQEIKG